MHSSEGVHSDELLIRGAMLSDSATESFSQHLMVGRIPGGQLWGPHMSTYSTTEAPQSTSTRIYYGERVFDDLAARDDVVGVGDVTYAGISAQSGRQDDGSYGYLSSAAVDDVLSLYNSDELMRLRSELLEHLSTADRYAENLDDLDTQSMGTLRLVKSSAMAAMNAIKQTASCFVSSLLSSVVAGMAAESSAEASEILSPDDYMTSNFSRWSHHTTSDPSLNEACNHLDFPLDQHVREHQSPIPILAALSQYSTYDDASGNFPCSFSGPSRDTNKHMPLIRVDVLGESESACDNLQRSSNSGEITLSSTHQLDMPGTSQLGSPVHTLQAFPKRGIKKMNLDPSGLRSRSNSPSSPARACRHRPPSVSPEPRIHTAPVAHSLEAYFDDTTVGGAPGCGGDIPAIMRELPRRPKSHVASRYSGAKHRVLVDSTTTSSHTKPTKGSVMSNNPSLMNETERSECSARDWRHLAGSEFTQPGRRPSDSDIVHMLELSSESETLINEGGQSPAWTGLDQDEKVVEIRNKTTPARTTPRVPSGLLIQGTEATTVPVRTNKWRGGYKMFIDEQLASHRQAGSRNNEVKSGISVSFPMVTVTAGSADSLSSLVVEPTMSNTDRKSTLQSVASHISSPSESLHQGNDEKVTVSQSATSRRESDNALPLATSKVSASSQVCNAVLRSEMFAMHIDSRDDILRIDTPHTGHLSPTISAHVPLAPPPPHQPRSSHTHTSSANCGNATAAASLRSDVQMVRPQSVHQSSGDREYFRLSTTQSLRPSSVDAVGVQAPSNSARTTTPRTLEDIYNISHMGPDKPSSAHVSGGSGVRCRVDVDRSRVIRTAPLSDASTGVRGQLSNPKGYVPKPPPRTQHQHKRKGRGQGRGATASSTAAKR